MTDLKPTPLLHTASLLHEPDLDSTYVLQIDELCSRDVCTSQQKADALLELLRRVSKHLYNDEDWSAAALVQSAFSYSEISPHLLNNVIDHMRTVLIELVPLQLSSASSGIHHTPRPLTAQAYIKERAMKLAYVNPDGSCVVSMVPN